MNERILDLLERRMNRGDSRRGGRRRDYRDERDYHDYRDERYYEDGRRGVRGSGRSRDRRDYEDMRMSDRRDYEDERDYGEPIRLSKTDIKHWKHKLENADGTHGEHFDMQQVVQAAERANIKFNDFDEKEFCIAVNMKYSDYCNVIKKYIPPDKELAFCVDMAKAFLDDADGPEPSEKLALYYHFIVCNDEV